ncbi:MAG TPA: glycosyltransferase family 4 protein [Syntrophothermus lipocalidus]|nr:glycosyltransferase family 4 protein [Syntrophothermus lipocalidus]
MRILQVVEACGGGVATHLKDLLLGLATRGHEVDLMYSPLRMDGNFEKFIDEIGRSDVPKIRNYRWHCIRNVNLFYDYEAFRELYSFILSNGPYDVIHGHSSKGGFLGRLAGTLADSKPARVYTPHAIVTLSGEGSRVRKSAYFLAEAMAGRFITDALIAVSREESDHVLSNRICKEDVVFLVENGIDPDSFRLKGESFDRESIRRDIGANSDNVVVLFVGRLCYQKAPDNLVKAFNLLNGCEWRLVIVGDGELYEGLAVMVGQLGLQERVSLLGYRQDVAQLMAAADIFCLPSRFEGMPYVLLEAMAAGKPIVTTEVCGATSLVIDGRGGYVVPHDRLDMLAERLNRLSDKELRERFGKYNLERVKSFTVERMVEETLKVYEIALKRRRMNKSRII